MSEYSRWFHFAEYVLFSIEFLLSSTIPNFSSRAGFVLSEAAMIHRAKEKPGLCTGAAHYICFRPIMRSGGTQSTKRSRFDSV